MDRKKCIHIFPESISPRVNATWNARIWIQLTDSFSESITDKNEDRYIFKYKDFEAKINVKRSSPEVILSMKHYNKKRNFLSYKLIYADPEWQTTSHNSDDPNWQHWIACVKILIWDQKGATSLTRLQEWKGWRSLDPPKSQTCKWW